MKNKYFKFFIILIAVAIIVPQIAMAAWWNPMSWGIWNSIFHFQKIEQKQNSISQQTLMQVKKAINQTTTWKTFTDSQYGFQFKYPADFSLTSLSQNYVEVKSSDPKNLFFFYIQVQSNKGNLTAQDYANNLGVAGPTAQNKNKVVEKITVDGIEAYKVTIDNLPSDADPTNSNYVAEHTLNTSTIYLIKNGNLYIFEVYNKSGLDKNYNVADFNLLLSTFKFTNTPVNNGNNPPIVGGDKDAHGCIGSAGYSWCEAKQKCLRSWEEPCDNTIKEIRIIAPVTVSNINLQGGNLDAKITPGNRAIRVVISSSTVFYSTCRGGDGLSNFLDLNKNWIGPNWWFTIKGPESNEGGIIFANEINCIAQ